MTHKKKQAELKREKVLERKSIINETGSNMRLLAEDKDSIWDLIGKEESFIN